MLLICSRFSSVLSHNFPDFDFSQWAQSVDMEPEEIQWLTEKRLTTKFGLQVLTVDLLEYAECSWEIGRKLHLIGAIGNLKPSQNQGTNSYFHLPALANFVVSHPTSNLPHRSPLLVNAHQPFVLVLCVCVWCCYCCCCCGCGAENRGASKGSCHDGSERYRL